MNLYLPRDNFDVKPSHVIPELIRKCLEQAKVAIPRSCPGDGTLLLGPRTL
jgi:hypothetical protein